MWEMVVANTKYNEMWDNRYRTNMLIMLFVANASILSSDHLRQSDDPNAENTLK